MATKSKAKSKPKSTSKTKSSTKSKGKAAVKAKTTSKSKGAVKAKSVRKTLSSAKAKGKEVVKKTKLAKPRSQVKAVDKKSTTKKQNSAPAVKPVDVTRTVAPVIVKRAGSHATERRRTSRPNLASIRTANQFAFMKAPTPEHAFEVGDNVEVFCDHEKGRERVRGWIKGIVVQVDNKMVAVQFRSNVFLTDGWMVPDRILWYPLTSEHIRPVAGKKSASKKDLIPDY